MREEYIGADIEQKGKEWLEKLRRCSIKRAVEAGVLDKAALLVIDMQNFFLDEKSHAFIPAAKNILPNIKNLVSAFMTQKLPVIFTIHSLNPEDKKDTKGMMARWWRDKVYDNTKEAEIIQELTEESRQSTVIHKSKYGCFKDTELDKLLRKNKINTLVITGVLTHLCCDTTAREAFMNDYTVIFVVDGTATYTEEFHLSSLKGLVHGFVIPTVTGELVEKIRK